MPSVKKYPFYSSEEVQVALEKLRRLSAYHFAIADIILRTGAELSDVLLIETEQIRRGEYFTVDDNPRKSVCLERYRELLSDSGRGEDKGPYAFVQKNGEVLKETSVRSAISRLSSSGGEDVSLIRFQKTFYLDYMVKHKSRAALKEVASSGRINEFCNENWIKEYLGLSQQQYEDIMRGKFKEIVSDNGKKVSRESLLEVCICMEQELQQLKKDVKKMSPESREEISLILSDSLSKIRRNKRLLSYAFKLKENSLEKE